MTAQVTNLRRGETDAQRVDLHFNGLEWTVYNVYQRPGKRCDVNLCIANEVTFKRTILAGDFNARSQRWGYADCNLIGKTVEDLLDRSNLVVLQSEETPPTFLHTRHGTESRPDLSLLSSDLLARMRVLKDVGSDHLPILLAIDANRPRRSLRARPFEGWRYVAADWELYRATADEELGKVAFGGSVDGIYAQVQSAILRAAALAIPKKGGKRYSPFWSRTLAEAVKERRNARSKVARDPSAVNRTNYNRLSARVKRITKAEKRAHWSKRTESLDLASGGRQAFQLLDRLKGIDRNQVLGPISKPNGSLVNAAAKKAEILNRHFARVNKAGPKDGKVKRERRVLEREAKVGKTSVFTEEISLKELNTALSRLSLRKAAGPDKISNEMLINLGLRAKLSVLRFINLTWREGTLPSVWKSAEIVPVPKNKRDATDPRNYRPISLTSCLSKLAERIVNARLYGFLEGKGLLCEEQAGFRRNRRPMDQVVRFVQRVSDGLRERVNTTAVFVDLQQAYDRVWRSGLLLKLLKLGVTGKLYFWIQNFLMNRTIRTKYEGCKSKCRTLEEGLPQGSALSCTLFLAFINDVPTSISCELGMFADDLVLWTSGKDVQAMQAEIQESLDGLHAYLVKWRLNLNTEKTVYTVFTKSPIQRKKEVVLLYDGARLQRKEHPKYLGVTLDPVLSFKPHVEELMLCSSRRLTILKKLAGTSWGARFNVLKKLYTAYVRPVMDYSMPIAAFICKRTFSALETLQNRALRFVSGALRSTPAGACEIMTGVEPLAERRDVDILATYERFRRYPRGDFRRELLSEWRDSGKQVRNCFLRAGSRFSREAGLADLPLVETRTVPSYLPNDAPPAPEIRTRLLDRSAGKNLDPLVLRTLAAETIDTYPKEALLAFTDGSRTDDRKTGFGFFISFPDGKQIRRSGNCGGNRSNYGAEAIAIYRALVELREIASNGRASPDRMVILTDSRSTLEALQRWPEVLDDPILGKVGRVLEELRILKKEVTLQWIPGHSGISGNEIADSLAKAGTLCEPHPRHDMNDIGSSYVEARSSCREWGRKRWLSRWAAADTARSTFAIMPSPERGDPWRSLPRKDQSVIMGLRTRHAPLHAHLARIGARRDAICRHCKTSPETVEHLLLECPSLSVARKKYLPADPSIRGCVYGNAGQLRKTSTFYELAIRGGSS